MVGKGFFRLVALVLVLLAVTSAKARAAGDASGNWKWKVTGQNGQERELAATLKADGEKLTGTISLPGGNTVEIKDGAVKGDEVTFTTVFERNGQTMTAKYKGKLDGDTIKGTIDRERDGQVNSRPWEAKREKA